MKWNIKISEVGSEVQKLLQSSKQFDLVIEGKREDMREYTVHFSGELPGEPLREGDQVTIGNTDLFIVALGKKVNEHLRGHGACTVDLSGGLVAKGDCVMMLDGVFEGYGFLQNGAQITVA